MGNSKIIKQRPHYDPKEIFFFGGDLEEQMIYQFNSYDIIWYSPEDSEKLEEWRAFSNINIVKISKEEQMGEFILMGWARNLIIITTGSFAEKLFPKINQNDILPDFLIYCMNVDFHKNWSKKYKFVAGVFKSNICIFINYQKSVIEIPIFNYKIYDIEEFNFNYYDSLDNKEFFVNQNNFDLRLNKYEKFCLKCFKYFSLVNAKYKNFLMEFAIDVNDILQFFNGETYNNNINNNLFGESANIAISLCHIFNCPLNIDEKAPKYLNEVFLGLTLISFYFSKLPYLYGYLNYQEVETLLKQNLEINDLRKDYNYLLKNHFVFLVNKLVKKKESILEETKHLKFIQSFLIKFLKFDSKIQTCLFQYDEYSKYPVMIKYLTDIDFCLKLFFCYIYKYFKNGDLDIKCRSAIEEVDKRI